MHDWAAITKSKSQLVILRQTVNRRDTRLLSETTCCLEQLPTSEIPEAIGSCKMTMLRLIVPETLKKRRGALQLEPFQGHRERVEHALPANFPKSISALESHQLASTRKEEWQGI